MDYTALTRELIGISIGAFLGGVGVGILLTLGLLKGKEKHYNAE